MKRTVCLVGIALMSVCGPAVKASELGEAWTTQGGRWQMGREIVPFLHQRGTEGEAAALHQKRDGADGVWRAAVKLSHGTEEAGLWTGRGERLESGLFALVGRYSAVGGFVLRSADGTVLWEDKYAPWHPYHPYVVEIVSEGDQIRVQMFEGDGQTLVSQSPWLADPGRDPASRRFGLFARDGAARFFRPEHADEPLSPIVADPPNLRRLVREDDSPWLVEGPGNWMWTTSGKERLRQYAPCERTWAMHRGTRGAHRKWECCLEVDPGTKGAGMLFQTNEERSQGFIAWLGGKYGAGSLMLYQYEPETRARWSGGSDSWHYDTEYLLRAETRPGQARVELLEADGTTVISKSGWIEVGEKYAAKEGFVAFHTWGGRAEFWGFSEATQADMAKQAKPDAKAVQLGAGWEAFGDGRWLWVGHQHARLSQQDNPKRALAMSRQLTGGQGTWRCRVRGAEGANAVGLVFQAGPERKQGFACLLTAGGARLETLLGQVLWEDPKWTWQPTTEYLLEGIVTTDRVAVRVLAADGKTVLAASPDVYVPESNNAREGRLGVIIRGAPGEFRGWEIE